MQPITISEVEYHLRSIGFNDKAKTYPVIPQISKEPSSVVRVGQPFETMTVRDSEFRKPGSDIVFDTMRFLIWTKENMRTGRGLKYGKDTAIETMGAFIEKANELIEAEQPQEVAA